MKLNKVAMAVALTAALGSMSALADTTNGQIELQGELVNTACGLAPSSSPVTVDFGQVQFPCCKAVVRQLKPKTSSCSIAIPPSPAAPLFPIPRLRLTRTILWLHLLLVPHLVQVSA
jgi:hypothetical protein